MPSAFYQAVVFVLDTLIEQRWHMYTNKCYTQAFQGFVVIEKRYKSYYNYNFKKFMFLHFQVTNPLYLVMERAYKATQPINIDS